MLLSNQVGSLQPLCSVNKPINLPLLSRLHVLYTFTSPDKLLVPTQAAGSFAFFFSRSAVSRRARRVAAAGSSRWLHAPEMLWPHGSWPPALNRLSLLGTMTEQFLGQKLWLHFFLESLSASLE